MKLSILNKMFVTCLLTAISLSFCHDEEQDLRGCLKNRNYTGGTGYFSGY